MMRGMEKLGFTQGLAFLIVGAIGSSAAVALLVIVLTFKPDLLPAPFRFSDSIRVLDTDEVCPGQALRWSGSLDVVEAPTMLGVARSLWSVDQQRTIQLDESLDWAVYIEPARLDFTRTMTIPATAPPGRYEIRVGAQEFGTSAQVYVVPFTVRECGP